MKSQIIDYIDQFSNGSLLAICFYQDFSMYFLKISQLPGGLVKVFNIKNKKIELLSPFLKGSKI